MKWSLTRAHTGINRTGPASAIPAPNTVDIIADGICGAAACRLAAASYDRCMAAARTSWPRALPRTYVVGKHAAAAEQCGFAYNSGGSAPRPCASVPHCALRFSLAKQRQRSAHSRARTDVVRTARGQYGSNATSEIPEIDYRNTIPHWPTPLWPPRSAAPRAHCPRGTWWRGASSPRALLSQGGPAAAAVGVFFDRLACGAWLRILSSLRSCSCGIERDQGLSM